MKKIISFAWISLVIVITILSYTQVDLNLTLLNWKPYLDFQSKLTWLGYFNRSVNGLLFTLSFIGLTIGYLALVKSAHAKWISLEQLKKLAIATSFILLFSYSVFSHDIFNYIFDARIVTFYHQNPYEHKALDYPSDDWIRFMQWTHRSYPYGPTWLLITLIPSILGFEKLLPTYLLFKGLFVASYLVLLYYLIKILEYKKTKASAIPVCFALIAFNPLIIIDGLVSSRIDLVMASTLFIALYYHFKSSMQSYLWLFISGATKFATLGFLPLFLIGFNRLKEEKFIYGLFFLALLTAPLQMLLRGVQPWYFILPLTILPMLYPYLRLKLIVILSLLMLLPMTAYLHFIYTGVSQDALWFLWS
jgi:hypothetical protein